MSTGAKAQPGGGRQARGPLHLGGMRIRRKMIVLHTLFSGALAIVLLLALRPAIQEVVIRAERHEANAVLDLLAQNPEMARGGSSAEIMLRAGTSDEILLPRDIAEAARAAPGRRFEWDRGPSSVTVVQYDAQRDMYLAVGAESAAAREAVTRLYLFLTAALLGVYVTIAALLELLVFPRQVYGPIERLLRADEAVQQGRRDDELIPESAIPSDELGSIMRSRNESIVKLRRQEKALAQALDQLESVAMELKRKNHLLESARRNLADQDRLASLGMMSAGLAHELNTPLAVLKGACERIAEHPWTAVGPEQAALMVRVVHRLERLSESLLDFARVRPFERRPVRVRDLVDEAWMLVRLDREVQGVGFHNAAPESLQALGDEDRLGQVFVNLLRNAADAMEGSGEVRVYAEETERDGRRWVSVRIRDEGPGVAPEVLARLFEPFLTTRLDSRGTGLGLAVSEGIIKEHGGVILARNYAESASGAGDGAPRTAERSGAEFEVMLPVEGEGLSEEDGAEPTARAPAPRVDRREQHDGE